MRDETLLKYARPVPRYTSYPAATHFTPDVDSDVYRHWLRSLGPGETLSLYFHVPFCRSLCWFCGCNTTVVNNAAITGAYADTLASELRMVAATVASPRVAQVHWGGGTPTEIGQEALRHLMEQVRESFEVGEDAEVAIEVDPRTLTKDLAATLVSLGFNRVSLGVQDIDPAVQIAVNRVQPLGLVEEAAGALRKAGIESINVDLMVGLPHQTVDGVAKSAAAILDAVSPDRLAVFPYAHVPWMKRHQQLIKDDTLPDAGTRLALVSTVAEMILQHGYVQIGLDHFARKDEALAVAARNDRLHRNFQGYVTDEAAALIGIGASAISALPKGYAQNKHIVREYRLAIDGGDFATGRGVALSHSDRARREIIERLMCYMAVDLGQVAETWQMSVSEFSGALASLSPLVADGLVSVSGTMVEIRDEAKPLARSVCAAFDEYLDKAPNRHSVAV